MTTDRTIDISEKFTDLKGREWELVFDGAMAYAIHKELGIKCLDITGGMLPALNDEHQTIDMLWTCCRERAQRIGVTVKDFAEALDDVVIASGRQALWRAYIGFFRNPTRRAALERLRSVIEETQRRMGDALIAAIGRGSSEPPVSPESDQHSGASGCES